MDGVTSQSGRAPILPIVIMAVLGVGLGAFIFLYYDQTQRAEQERRLLQGEITDLRYQLKQEGQSSPTPSPTPTPEVTPTPSPTPTPAPVLGDQTTAPAERTATTKSFVRLRARATTSSAVLAGLNKGTVVTLGPFSSSTWQEVTVGGQHGYVAKSYLIY